MIKTVAKISKATADAIKGESYGIGLYNPVQGNLDMEGGDLQTKTIKLHEKNKKNLHRK